MVDDEVPRAINFTVLDSTMNGKEIQLKNYKHLNLTLPMC